MMKSAVVIFLLIIGYNALAIPNEMALKLVDEIVEKIFIGPKPYLNNIQVTRVETKPSNGGSIDYQIDFFGETKYGQKTTCQVVANVVSNSVRMVRQSQCQTS